MAGGTGHKRQGRIRTGAFARSHCGWLRGLAGGPVLWSGWRANPKGWLACTGLWESSTGGQTVSFEHQTRTVLFVPRSRGLLGLKSSYVPVKPVKRENRSHSDPVFSNLVAELWPLIHPVG